MFEIDQKVKEKWVRYFVENIVPFSPTRRPILCR
jgi:hypothetical protein